MIEYPYIKIDLSVDTDAIEKDVCQLKKILIRLSAGLNQELILIMGNEVIRINESDNA